jgi:hypothetical protein
VIIIVILNVMCKSHVLVIILVILNVMCNSHMYW